MSAETKESVQRARIRRARTGVVVSDAMNKTVIVAVERMVQHSSYKRIVHRTSKFYAHDENNECQKGDQVTIVESRPMSKLKRWRLREVVRKASAAVSAPASAADSEDRGRITKKRGKDGEESGADSEEVSS
jgi:small subunit ribosomal protein S17